MDIASLIGNYAFPIVACMVMAYYVKYITDKNAEATSKLNEEHTKEMLAFKDEMKEALNNNTLAITKLTILLGKEEKESGEIK